jgi:hypothetical protein
MCLSYKPPGILCVVLRNSGWRSIEFAWWSLKWYETKRSGLMNVLLWHYLKETDNNHKNAARVSKQASSKCKTLALCHPFGAFLFGLNDHRNTLTCRGGAL